MYIPHTCVPTWTHVYVNVHTTTHADGVCPPILLNKKAHFLSLTSKLNIILKINKAEVGVLSLFHVFIQPVFPEYPLCAGPYAQYHGGKHKWGLRPAPQEYHMQVQRRTMSQ